jgi:CysZ protein
MTPLFLPLSRALAQLTDPALLGVVWRSVMFSALFFIVILAGTIGAVHHFVTAGGLVAWALDALGSIAASVLAMWLFLPVAAVIGSLYLERIARAVEWVYYRSLPPAQSAPMWDQLTVSLGVGLRVLGLNLLALLLTLLLPGIGLPIGWAVASWAMGRGLFVAVALRRLNRSDTEALYRTVRPIALVQGAAMAAAAYFPLLNLLIPVVGTAAMVHVLDLALVNRNEFSRSANSHPSGC